MILIILIKFKNKKVRPFGCPWLKNSIYVPNWSKDKSVGSGTKNAIFSASGKKIWNKLIVDTGLIILYDNRVYI